MNKNLTLLLAFALLFLSNFMLPVSGQFLTNPDFENWPAGCPINTPPDGWLNYSTSLGPDQAGTCAGTVTSYSGDSHMNLVWANNGLREGAEQVMANALSGHTYSLSFYAINDQGLYSSPGSIILDVYVDGFLTFSTPELMDGGAWTQYSTTFTVISTSPPTIGFRVEQGLTGTSGSVGIDSVVISDLNAVDADIADLGIHLYPNPAQEELTLTLPAGTPTAEVELIDSWGRSIHRYHPEIRNHKAQLNVSAYPAGVYMVRILVDDQFVTRRVLIE